MTKKAADLYRTNRYYLCQVIEYQESDWKLPKRKRKNILGMEFDNLTDVSTAPRQTRHITA